MKFFLSIIIAFTVSICNAQEITIPNSGISFIAPDGFQPLSEEWIDIRWQRKNPPRWAVSSDSMETTIAYDIKPIDISNESLENMLETYKRLFPRVMAGLIWKKHEIVEISGQKWIYLEMITNSIDTEIYNIILITSYGNEMLMFNFNSTKEEFSKYEKALRNSVQTIKLPQKK